MKRTILTIFLPSVVTCAKISKTLLCLAMETNLGLISKLCDSELFMIEYKRSPTKSINIHFAGEMLVKALLEIWFFLYTIQLKIL